GLFNLEKQASGTYSGILKEIPKPEQKTAKGLSGLAEEKGIVEPIENLVESPSSTYGNGFNVEERKIYLAE